MTRKKNPPEGNNIHWTETRGMRIKDRGKLYVATDTAGKEHVVFWNGKETNQARTYLRRRAMED